MEGANIHEQVSKNKTDTHVQKWDATNKNKQTSQKGPQMESEIQKGRENKHLEISM